MIGGAPVPSNTAGWGTAEVEGLLGKGGTRMSSCVVVEPFASASKISKARFMSPRAKTKASTLESVSK